MKELDLTADAPRISSKSPFGFFRTTRCSQELHNVFWLVPPRDAEKWFEFWQTHRKFVWHKFATIPSNLEVLQVKLPEGGLKTTTFRGSAGVATDEPWDLESLTLHASNGEDVPPELVNLWGDRSSQKKLIRSTCSPDEAVLFYLFDGARKRATPSSKRDVSEDVLEEDDSLVLRLHRLLVPFQLSIYAADAGRPEDFAEALRLDLVDHGFSFFDGASVRTCSEEEHRALCDARGVPLTIHIDSETSTTGKLELRNRETTLKEQMHVTRLVPFLTRYFSS